MKSRKTIKLLTMAMVLLGAVASSAAWADRGHHGGHHGRGGAHVGLFFSAPLVWPYAYGPYYPYSYYPYSYYPYYYPYYPSGVLVQAAQPEVFVEQGQQQSSAQNYWYFCSNPKGYYPYVKECPPGWVQVTPQAPASK